jgi:Tfp pilus assembly protein PilN
MLQDIQHIFNLTPKVYAIDVEINGDGAYHCHVVELTRQKGSIHFTACEATGEPFDNISKKDPVCLILNGKGIIHRKIAVEASLTDTDIIKQIIPNVNPEDFYIQKQEIAQQKEKRTQIISLARKSFIDKVISDLSRSFDFIVNVSINPFALDDILLVIPDENVLHYKNIRIHLQENKVEDFTVQAENETQTLKIGDQSVDTILLPALGIGFSFLINPATNHTPIKTIRERNKEYLYKQKTQLIGKISLLSIFFVLIINFFIFDHFYKKIQQEQPQVVKQEEMINKVKQLNETLSAKSKFLQQSGLLTPNKISFYADRIASTLPDDITLTDWQFNPPTDPNKKETFTFKNSIIVISGISSQSSGFNDWIKELKNNEGIESVSILGYDHDIKANTALFTIELTVQ